jgi:glucose-6-phosphate dehydrogenase assembly protein OpcA
METPLMVCTIDAELTRIWESLEKSNKIRASLFNLIFFTKKSEHEKYFRTIAQRFIEKFPSRVIFITANSEDQLRSHVSVVPIGEEGTACDFIEIDVGEKLLNRVPFVILPHILTDLPIYVIWAEESTEGPLFDDLKQLANRMIFDSETTSNLSQFAANLLSLKCDVGDLNWARTENWRKLLASTFYTQERLSALKDCSHIQIVYNGQPTQALYLQGWLATQLGWKLKKIENKGGHFTIAYEGQIVTLHPEESKSLPSGIILSVDLQTSSQEHFSFGRDLQVPNQIHMRFSSLEKCDIPLLYLFAKEESGASLVKEICYKGTSKHFLHLLQQIKERKEYANL